MIILFWSTAGGCVSVFWILVWFSCPAPAQHMRHWYVDCSSSLHAFYCGLQSLDRDSATLLQQQEEKLQDLEEKFSNKSQESQRSIASYQAQVQNLTEGLKKFQQQLAQTQALLGVVQQQRQALQSDNNQLRADLDEAVMKLRWVAPCFWCVG